MAFLATVAALCLGALPAVHAASDYDSARCVAYDRSCNSGLANSAQNWCRAGRQAHEQDPCCKARACHYCIHHRHVDFCKYHSLTHQCFKYWGQATSYRCQNGHTTHGGGHHQNQQQHHGHGHGHGHGYKTPAPSGGGGCIWRQGGGKHSIVINPSGYAHGNWQRTGDSITYKPWDYNPHHVDGQGSSTISFKFSPSESGEYRLTAKTYAPHHTEYNDMWIRFGGGQGVKLWKHGHQYWGGGWHKAYQNSYTSYDLFTKDHDPHSLVTPWLNAGQTYTVDVAGRSSRFKLERLIIKNTRYPHDSDLSVSQCY